MTELHHVEKVLVGVGDEDTTTVGTDPAKGSRGWHNYDHTWLAERSEDLE